MSMETKELTDVFKAAPSVTDASGSSVVLTDKNGELSTQKVSSLGLTFLNGTKTSKSHISLVDFLIEYVQGKYPGYMLTDSDFADATAWYLDVNGTLSLNIQRCLIVVLKCNKRVQDPWAQYTLLSLPISGLNGYIINYTVGSSTSEMTVAVKKWEFTSL